MKCTFMLCCVAFGIELSAQQIEDNSNNAIKLKYQNPKLKVDLAVGLWASPLPMDYDNDGDIDLIISCTDVPFNGTYFFENISGDSVDTKNNF